MNPPPPESDPGFESLLRQRAARLAAPDPVWRHNILHPVDCRSGPPAAGSFPFWRSLAACWAAITLFHWDAGREMARYAHYANPQAAAMAMGNSSTAILIAMASQ